MQALVYIVGAGQRGQNREDAGEEAQDEAADLGHRVLRRKRRHVRHAVDLAAQHHHRDGADHGDLGDALAELDEAAQGKETLHPGQRREMAHIETDALGGEDEARLHHAAGDGGKHQDDERHDQGSCDAHERRADRLPHHAVRGDEALRIGEGGKPAGEPLHRRRQDEHQKQANGRQHEPGVDLARLGDAALIARALHPSLRRVFGFLPVIQVLRHASPPGEKAQLLRERVEEPAHA